MWLDNNGNVIGTVNNIVPKRNSEVIYKKSGYHTLPIRTGKLGELSKIQEELDELKDAEFQGNKIMMAIEMSDLYGALELYAEANGLTITDLKTFSDLNKKVKSGREGTE